MTYLILKSGLIDGAKLLQQYDRILDQIIFTTIHETCVGNFALCNCDVIAAQITVGEWIFPTSF